MVCKSQAFFGVRELNKPFANWNGDVVFSAEEYWEPAHDSLSSPTGLGHLVFAVAAAAAANKRLTTVGSGWAFENLIQTDGWLISLKKLDRRLDYVTGPVVSNGLTDAWRAQLLDPTGRRLVHVEAGIEVGALNDLLNATDGEPLALPVLGGANGQSLAGVISTSTHGGDWQQPPFPDLVRAIHLVTEGGREVWIERASEPVTVDDRLRPLLPCGETQIVRDDEVFNAALVAFGRFGVIYAVILEVRRAFNVAEVVTIAGRDPALKALEDGARAARPLDPLFTLLAAPPLASTLQVGGEAVGDPYFCQLIFNSQDTTMCWAQRRWLTDNAQPLNIPTDPGIFFPITTLAGMSLLNLTWAAGIDVGGLMRSIMNEQFAGGMVDGRRGPHHLLTSGTRESSHQNTYRGDSIEVMFAHDDKNFVPFLRGVLLEAKNYKQAGYISVRLSLVSRATMSMHNFDASHAYSVEVSTLKSVPQGKDWMHFVHYQALAHGGRPHWGQYNKLDQPWVESLYGKNLRRWHHALWALTRASDRFSSDYTRKRGLDPENLRRVTSVFRTASGTLTHLVGQDGAPWSPASVRDAIAGIRNGSAVYAIDSGAGLSFIVAVENPKVGGVYLRTEADNTASDNLATLPLAPGPVPATTDDADVASLNCPRNVPVGQTETAFVTMANSGTSIWERGQVLLVPLAASGIRFSPVALSQTTTAFQKAVFPIPIAAGPAGTKSTLSCRLMKDGRPFGSATETFTVVFTDPNEPTECVAIRDQIAALEAEIEALTADLDPNGDPREQAQIRGRLIELNRSLARVRARGVQLGCTLS
jgi:hypothetical protein